MLQATLKVKENKLQFISDSVIHALYTPHDRLERLAIARSFALSSVFLHNGGHSTVQRACVMRQTHGTCITTHNHVTKKCLHSIAEPSPYVCFSLSIEGESVMC